MRKFKVTVDGTSYEVEVEEIGGGVSAPVAQVAPVAKPAQSVKVAPANGAPIKAPMPGTILKLVSQNGATVKKGQPIIVLEAMKMENDIVADRDGVLTYTVKQGDNVESGAVLATIA